MIAEPWCKGDYERALFLAMAEENSHDRGREQEQKKILRDNWGKWLECKDKLDRSHRRSIVTFLCDHPTNFKRAIALIRTDLRSIYIAAFQSALWNRWLSKLIESKFGESTNSFDSIIGKLALPSIGGCDAATLQWLGNLSLPLPSARQHDWPEECVGLLDEILQQYGMTRREIRLKYPRDTFFSKGIRNCWLKPREFEFSWTEDDLHDKHKALQLSFSLPRGSYATMLVKILSE
jgi:tRNA pseudouridine13 synthase